MQLIKNISSVGLGSALAQVSLAVGTPILTRPYTPEAFAELAIFIQHRRRIRRVGHAALRTRGGAAEGAPPRRIAGTGWRTLNNIVGRFAKCGTRTDSCQHLHD